MVLDRRSVNRAMAQPLKFLSIEGTVRHGDQDLMPEQTIRLTPRLCRAARAMLGWRQADLFEASRVPAPTIEAFELKPETARMMGANMRALIAAFEAAGLEFIPENGGGAGIRFRERTK